MKVATFHRLDARIGRFSRYDQAVLVHDDATKSLRHHVVVHVVVIIVVVEMVVAPVVEPVIFVIVRFGNHPVSLSLCTCEDRRTPLHNLIHVTHTHTNTHRFKTVNHTCRYKLTTTLYHLRDGDTRKMRLSAKWHLDVDAPNTCFDSTCPFSERVPSKMTQSMGEISCSDHLTGRNRARQKARRERIRLGALVRTNLIC